MRRSRDMQISDEKANYPSYMTSREVCLYLHINPRVFRARRQKGKIPEPAVRTPHGWGLWSPDQTAALLREELKK